MVIFKYLFFHGSYNIIVVVILGVLFELSLLSNVTILAPASMDSWYGEHDYGKWA